MRLTIKALLRRLWDSSSTLDCSRSHQTSMSTFNLALCLIVLPLSPTWTFGQCDASKSARAASRLGIQCDLNLSGAFDERSTEVSQSLIDDFLTGARAVAEGLGDGSSLPVSHPERYDLICLLEGIQKSYEQIGDSQLRSRDRLSRGALRFTEVLIREAGEDPRNLGALVSGGTVDFHKVFGAAREIQSDPGSYAAYLHAAELGIDIEDPAPPFQALERLVSLGVSVSIMHPGFGPKIGTSLNSILCGAWHLYPARRARIERDHRILIQFDDGNLAASAPVYDFARRIDATFDIDAAGSGQDPCGPMQSDFPRWELRPETAIPLDSQLATRLTKAERLLESGVDRLVDVGNAWAPYEAYADLLFALWLSIDDNGSGAEDGRRDLVDLLAVRQCDALVRGIHRSADGLGPATRRRLNSKLACRCLQFEVCETRAGRKRAGYGRRLFGELRFSDLIRFASRYQGSEDLSEHLRREVHALLARGYHMRGDRTKALKHVHLSNISAGSLKALAKEMRSLGVDLPRKD